ncbi:hypothetical protein [[Mycoplasma] gypis]|uniref:Uncharacterized protein n=1 Tax=[Mycoplasma] gypis TaxID=92404 RepID=A0ABZ2RPC9_9BACT|nr:hypothetical protein [[Mycoplasma] gypis]MBN0919443.1 hypothetical protein [[Mycoplasma] gypis]
MSNFLDELEKQHKPLKKRTKKILIFLGVFAVIFLISTILLFTPFKKESTFELIIKEFKQQQYDSILISKLVAGFFTWVFIVWTLSLRIAQSILFYKYRKIVNNEIEKIDSVSTEQTGKELHMSKLNAQTKKQARDENFIANLLNTCIALQKPLIGSATMDVREILNNPQYNSKQKKLLISQLLKNNGIDPKNKKILEVITKL